jgi:hypothetical protein
MEAKNAVYSKSLGPGIKESILKVPKCEKFRPLVFYVNKSHLGRRPKDWIFVLFIMKTEADICHFIFFTHAECALKNCLITMSVR